METPNNIAGELTEKIMNRLCGKLNPDPVLKDVDTRTHNRMYSEVYAVLEKTLLGAEGRAERLAQGAHKR
jgi:hypothetical protein